MDEITKLDGLNEQSAITAPVENLFANLAQPVIDRIYGHTQPPGSLFHYTSAAGLIGIVTNHSLWFSDAPFMNDGSETTYGVEAMSLIIDEFMANRTAIEKEAGDALKAEVANAMRHFQPVIFCMSARNNLLNQWRDYGKDIVPYCIELDIFELTQWERRQCNFPVFITKVVYDGDFQRELMLELMASIYERAKYLLGDRKTLEEDEARNYLMSAAIEIVSLVSRFKNPAFESEEEWRAICYRPHLEGRVNRKYRVTSLGAIPYYEWFSNLEPKNLPIRSVTVGPSPFARVSDLALKQLLVDHGYSDNTHYSTIPIRR